MTVTEAVSADPDPEPPWWTPPLPGDVEDLPDPEPAEHDAYWCGLGRCPDESGCPYLSL